MANEPVITVTGNLGADAEYKTTKSNISVTSFSMANTVRKQVNNEWVDGDTIWFKVSLWKDELGQQLRKGNKVKVTGRLTQSTWVDEDGNKNTTLVINSDLCEIVPKAGDEQSQKPEDNFE